MATSEEIFREAMALPADARAELTERLVESLAQDISPEITTAQLTEVRRRIAQVESGEVELIPGDEALARVRNLLSKIVDLFARHAFEFDRHGGIVTGWKLS
jgi:putative addiction module component (TIGR02574 family)